MTFKKKKLKTTECGVQYRKNAPLYFLIPFIVLGGFFLTKGQGCPNPGRCWNKLMTQMEKGCIELDDRIW